MTTLNLLRVMTEKLRLLNHKIEELKVDFRKLNTDDDRKSYYVEVKSIMSSEINYDKTYNKPSSRPTNLKDKFEQCLKESGERQEIQNEWMKKIMISTDLSLKNHDFSIKRPMLATAHTKIDVYGKKITLGVEQDQGIKSLLEDGDNLKFSAKFQISKQCSRSLLSLFYAFLFSSFP
ncbi:hypothetical protein Tco_1312706 [Tanacetum coccineum]